MTENTDDLIQEHSTGTIQTATIEAQSAEENLRTTLSTLGIDLRTSMPDDEECIEYKLRDSLEKLSDVHEQLEDEAW